MSPSPSLAAPYGESCHAGREFHIENGDSTVFTLVPVGNVLAIATVLYAVSESGGGTSGGSTTCLRGATVNLYTDGVDIYTLAVSAGGAVSVYRSAGAAVFDARIYLVWI
jgi:hypothetical protein